MLLLPSSIAFNPLNTAFSQTENNQPNINATSVFDTGQMILGDNIIHLVILIPDEGHHGPGEEDEHGILLSPLFHNMPSSVLELRLFGSVVMQGMIIILW